MRKVWLGITTIGMWGSALLWAVDVEENQNRTGHFSESKYENFRPPFHNKPAAGEPYSENKVQQLQHTPIEPAIENPATLKQQAQQFQQKNQPPAPPAPTTPASTPSTPTVSPAQISQALQQAYPQMGNWFNPTWWANHGVNPALNPAANWWAGANWGAASQWAGVPVGTPVYYDPNGTTTTVTLPASSTTSNPSASKAQAVDKWMPLGVYAIGTETTGPSNATAFLQLAVNSDGQVAGTYYDSTTDKAQNIKGYYDKDTQEITWQIAGMPDSPIMQTGIYNLTLDQTPINVILPDTSKQTWSLVKIQR